jgi:dipeptidyl aminopeptidase/acylaminoacyl peptidase
MKPVQIEDLLSYRFLSSVQIDPRGRHAAFRVRQANEEGDDYRSEIYVIELDSRRTRRLTTAGKDGPFVWNTDGSAILFLSKREESKEESDDGSRLYRIALDGGEAEKIATIPHHVEAIQLIADDSLLFTARIPLTTDEDKNAADYEVLDEIPFWQNEKGFTNQRRVHLFSFDLASGEVKDLTEDQLEVQAFDAHKDLVAFVARRFPGKAPITDELWVYNLATGESRCLSHDTYALGEVRFLSETTLAVLGTDMKRYGRGQSREVMSVDLASGEITSITPGWDRSVGTSVGSDCRYGSGPVTQVDQGRLYLTITEGGNSYIDSVDPNGTVERVVDLPGAIDSFAVHAETIIYSALRGDRLQEIYRHDKNGEERFTDLNRDACAERAVSHPEPFIVTGKDGTRIEAWVMKPANYEEGESYPTLLEIHGGPRGAYGSVFFHEMQVLAGAGYVVLYCNPRGSSGRGDEFADVRGKYGTIDYEDLMAVVDYAIESFPFVDRDRLGVLGGSYGGFMTNWIIGHTNRFRAACSQRSIANWISKFCTTDIGYVFNKDQMGKTPWEEAGSDKLWWHSPLRYADRARTPTLFIHSDEDYRCYMAEGLQMFTALRYHGVESRLVLFRGENHELSRSGKPHHRLRRLREILSWFDQYLKGGPKGNP